MIVFCEECRQDVEIKVYNKQKLEELKGVAYKYIGKEAFCANCNNEIYVNEVSDYNLRSLYNEYREKNDIISLDKILNICEKYGIGKRPLSLLLGWGELTFSRYCDGDMPTKQYSNILKKIYEDPLFYNKILEDNKKNLKSEAAYNKSKKAVEKLLFNKIDETSKINKVIEYLLDKCEDITPLALQKSLYYIQGFYYAFYKKFIFKEDCKAWVHGPVYPDVYFKYKDYKFDPINKEEKTSFLDFSKEEIEVLESVVKNICCYSGKTLEKFTHLEDPWILARGDLTKLEVSNNRIKKKDIAKYFEYIKEKYGMEKPSDIKAYTRKMFKQNI